MNPIIFFAVRNIMTGSGFEGGAYGGEWIRAWITVGILGIVVFLTVMAQKNDMLPIAFHFSGALLGVLAAILVITFTGATKIALVIGIMTSLVMGYIIGRRLE